MDVHIARVREAMLAACFDQDGKTPSKYWAVTSGCGTGFRDEAVVGELKAFPSRELSLLEGASRTSSSAFFAVVKPLQFHWTMEMPSCGWELLFSSRTVDWVASADAWRGVFCGDVGALVGSGV